MWHSSCQRLTKCSRTLSPAALRFLNNWSVTDRSQVPDPAARASRRKEPGLSLMRRSPVAAILENLGVTVDSNEIEHSCQLSDFSISVKLRMSGRDYTWHRTCQVMYRKPVRTGESVPSTYMTFDVMKAEEPHSLVCSQIEEGFQVSNLRILYRPLWADLCEGQSGWTKDQVDILYT